MPLISLSFFLAKVIAEGKSCWLLSFPTTLICDRLRTCLGFSLPGCNSKSTWTNVSQFELGQLVGNTALLYCNHLKKNNYKTFLSSQMCQQFETICNIAFHISVCASFDFLNFIVYCICAHKGWRFFPIMRWVKSLSFSWWKRLHFLFLPGLKRMEKAFIVCDWNSLWSHSSWDQTGHQKTRITHNVLRLHTTMAYKKKILWSIAHSFLIMYLSLSFYDYNPKIRSDCRMFSLMWLHLVPSLKHCSHLFTALMKLG